jgi:ubiquinone/menaquinone biosynthesis C-methylase UbiE
VGRGPSDDPFDRRLGRRFDKFAADYDAGRHGYPDSLIDEACGTAGLAAGDAVLEIGPGSGQLTVSLVARQLAVTAIEPGSNLLDIARAKTPAVEFINRSLEDTELPDGSFKAAFAASSIHWPDADVSWRQIARWLAPRGVLALLTHYGMAADDDQPAILQAWRDVAPEIAATFPALRDRDTIVASVKRHDANVSAAWEALNDYLPPASLRRDVAAELYEDVQVSTVVTMLERNARQMIGLMATNRSFRQLPPESQGQLAAKVKALESDLGRPLRSSTITVLVTVRRR